MLFQNNTNILDMNGVCSLQSDDCNAIYIDEKDRKLEIRIKEHRKQPKSNFLLHLLNTGHKSLNNDNVKKKKMLHSCDKSYKLKLLEAY